MEPLYNSITRLPLKINNKYIKQKKHFRIWNASFRRRTRGKSQAPSTPFLAFLIVSKSSYKTIQSIFPNFSPKIFRLTDLDINSK